MKISTKVPLVVSSIIVLIFAGFSWFQFEMTRRSLYEKTTNNIYETSTVLSEQISTWLNERLAIVDAMSQIIGSDFSAEQVERTMKIPEFTRKFLQFFGGIDSEGGKLITNDPNYNPEGWDARKRPWYPVAKNNGQAALTEPYNDALTNELLISAVANIYDGRKVVGAFGGDIALKAVSDALNSVNFNNAGYAYLVNNSGTIISHPDAALYNKNIQSLYDGSPLRIDASFQEAEVNGKTVITVFYPLKNVFSADWYIGVVVDKATVLSDARDLGRNAIIASILGALLCSLIIYLFMNKLVINPVKDLTSFADEVSRGKSMERLTDGYTGRKDEIGDLANGFERMRKSLRIAMSRMSARKRK